MYQLLPIKYALKLPSEATPTSFAIQNQIQAVCLLIAGKNAPYESRVDTNSGLPDNGSGKDRSVILYLASQGANVNARDKYGLTPLHYAGMRGNDDAAVDLLQLSNTNIEVI